MRRFAAAAGILFLLGWWNQVSGWAQSLDDLNVQVHGFATQGFLYSTKNNWNTTDSSDGSAAWTEAVLNVTAQPQSKLRIGVQGRFYLLGSYGNAITLDWAEGDYKANEHFGFRVGKVKTPSGMLNETQDIDPAHLWILLPQSIYPLSSRDSILAHYGGVLYGSVELSERLGKVEYRAYGGERVVGANDGALERFTALGIAVPGGLTGRVFGATLHWKTPLQGLVLGVNVGSERQSGSIALGGYQGTLQTLPFTVPYFFARYERKKLMLGGEYSRSAPHGTLAFNGVPPADGSVDQRNFYAMSSYKLAQKLTAGLYYSSSIDRQAAFTSDRYQKDWALAARYDFNPYLYAKFEQHFMDGTELGYSTSNNANLQPQTRMTLLKLGVSF